MKFRSFFLGGLALVASLSFAFGQVNTVPQVGVITNFNTQKQSYAATASFAAASAATDAFTISGSSTKTIKVQKVIVTGITTSAAAVSAIDIIKRSTAVTTGAAGISPVKVPLDANNAAATALVNAYTSNPTVGTLVGVISARLMLYSLATTAVSIVPAIFDYSSGENLLAQPITLRGAGQTLAVNLGGTPVNATVNVTVVWTEE